mmetsp:Transcript_7989/g.11404  ORF Transcript_7989/g.11404 Transcript_7989/m.11404 type:complete len:151 (-) Transcript_7989:1648-2100(-)
MKSLFRFPKNAWEKKGKRKFIPHKAAVQLSEKARMLFQTLLQHAPSPSNAGIILKYQQSSSGEPRMVFTFGFVNENDVEENDERVSLEVLEDGSPKPPMECLNDGLPKLIVHQSAFIKVLGGTLDVNMKKDGSFEPLLYDKEGNKIDPNA